MRYLIWAWLSPANAALRPSSVILLIFPPLKLHVEPVPVALYLDRYLQYLPTENMVAIYPLL